PEVQSPLCVQGEPKGLAPAGLHEPTSHTPRLPEHTVPQPPQFAGSSEKTAQPPLHTLNCCLHADVVSAHRQTSRLPPAGRRRLQQPQLLGSCAKSAQKLLPPCVLWQT